MRNLAFREVGGGPGRCRRGAFILRPLSDCVNGSLKKSPWRLNHLHREGEEGVEGRAPGDLLGSLSPGLQVFELHRIRSVCPEGPSSRSLCQEGLPLPSLPSGKPPILFWAQPRGPRPMPTPGTPPPQPHDGSPVRTGPARPPLCLCGPAQGLEESSLSAVVKQTVQASW